MNLTEYAHNIFKANPPEEGVVAYCEVWNPTGTRLIWSGLGEVLDFHVSPYFDGGFNVNILPLEEFRCELTIASGVPNFHKDYVLLLGYKL